jgi:type VI secretion system secreted protein VgrG
MTMKIVKTVLIALALILLGAMLAPNASANTILLTAANYGVLGGSTVTNTGPSVITGSLGLSPGSSVTGFPPGTVTGTMDIANANAVQAQVDLINAYNGLALSPFTSNLTGQNLGGLTLLSGVYFFMSSAQLTGPLVLNAQGLANQFFVFQIGSTLTTASASSVTIINPGANDGVFWQVGSSATLGAATSFLGNILALQSITLVTGANISCGRALAHNGAVTLDTNNISIGCGNVPGESGSGGLSGGGLVFGTGGVVVPGGGGGGTTPTPEPSTIALVGCGLVCLIALKRL